MKLKTILLLGVAVGCGLVAMLGVQKSMSGGGQSEAEEKVSVLMAVTDIEVGEVLTPENVTFREVSVETAPENSVLTEEQYAERSSLVKLYANDFVTTAKLSEPGVSGKSVAIPEGMRVVTVPVTDTTSHSGMLAPNDRVDVLVTYQTKTQRGMTTQTKVLLEYIEVFATGNKTASDSSKETEQKIKNVSLLVTPEQMPYVMLAEKKGTLSLSWRRKDDDEFVKVGSVNEELMHELQGGLDKDRYASSYPEYAISEDPEDSDQNLKHWMDEQEAAAAERAAAEAAAAEAAKAAKLATVEVAAVQEKPKWKMEIFHGEERLLVELELPEEEGVEPLKSDVTSPADGADSPSAAGDGTEPVSTETRKAAKPWESLLKGLDFGTGT